MGTTRKFAIGFGLASGALVTAWLLTGNRKKKTKEFINQRSVSIKKVLKKDRSFDDSGSYYI